MRLFPNNQTILEAVLKTEDHIASGVPISVSVSGGGDSDIIVDMFERVGYTPGQVQYVWFDTGLEYEATKLHLKFLEEKYGIEIIRHKAKKAIPTSCREYGMPFLSKRVSMYIHRLQTHGFQWEDDTFENLSLKYPRCLSALRWWCNEWGEKSRFNIEQNAGLKEFMLKNPPPPFSDRCCEFAKKNVGYEVEKSFDNDVLIVTGVRRAEGGIRAVRYPSCYTPADKHAAQFRPIFYFTDDDKRDYEEFCGVVHSACYTQYGLKRTGCACCPFGSGFEFELEVAKEYEPKLFKAANAIFGDSYDYMRKYREFKEEFKKNRRKTEPEFDGGENND